MGRVKHKIGVFFGYPDAGEVSPSLCSLSSVWFILSDTKQNQGSAVISYFQVAALFKASEFRACLIWIDIK